MTYSVMWTLLPVGYAGGGTGRLLFDAVASLKIDDNRPQLGLSPLRNWPQTLAAFGPLHVQVRGEPAPRPAVVRTKAPDGALWQAIFATATRVDKPAPLPKALPIAPEPRSFADTASALDTLFASAADTPTTDLTADHPAVRAIEAMALPAEARRTLAADTRRIADPIATYARSLATPQRTRNRSRAERAALVTPLDQVPAVERADFHQVVGLLLNHPILSEILGLRIRLEIDAFTDERLVRVTDGQGRLIQGEKPVRQPWSRVVATPAQRRLVMATQRSDTPEVVAGMVDVASPARRKEYLVTSIDVPGLSAQLEAHAQARKAETALRTRSSRTPPGKNRLPVRRDTGLTLARRGRPESVVRTQQQRAVALADPSSAAETVDGAPVLYADDVTVGFRLDVAVDDKPFASVMHRQVSYRIGQRELGGVDEGRIEGIVGVQQTDEHDVTTLRTGEEVASWDGWAIAVPKPGPKVAAQPGAPNPVTSIDPTVLGGYGIQIELRPARGTLPKLRYGHRHALRLRAVDLAGNSIEPAAIDPAQRIDAGPYLRHEAAPGPYVVPRRRYTFGESNERLVVRPEGGSGERHLAPPSASFALCEAHGLFDGAFGDSPDATAARARLLTLARREAGTFLDPTVVAPNGQTVPARGIGLVSNDPAVVPAVTLPIPRGDTLPNGVYVVHDTAAALTPYLPDPIVTGVTISGLGALPPLTVPFGSGSGQPGATGWPDRQPVRLVVQPTSKAEPKLAARAVSAGGRTDLVLFVPPGFDGTFELSCALDPDRLAELDTGQASTADVIAGRYLGLSARQPMSVVHPVKKPLAPPTMIGQPSLTPTAGGVGVQGTARFEVHRASSGTVDLLAEWEERIDTGIGELGEPRQRRLVVGSAVVDAGGTEPVEVHLVHDFGDTRHRRVRYRGVAATRFAEYFPRVPAGDTTQQLAGADVEVSVPNRGRPLPPEVHSIVPIFSHTTTASLGTISKVRKTRGLRVYLHRPWEQTGENERLGVVIPADTPLVGGQPPALSTLMQEYVSRWGGDPIAKGEADQAPVRLTALQFPNRVTGESPQLPLVDQALAAAGERARIVSHAVQFDPRRRLWFADIALDVPDQNWPFVRLALVRFQPQSVSDETRISPIVLTDFAQLPPGRTVSATREGTFGVRVKVSGTKPPIGVAAAGLGYTLRQERRMPDPLDPGLDLGSDAGIAPGWQVSSEPATGEFGLANLVLRWTGPAAVPPQAAELGAGRIVVEETVAGLPLLPDAPSTRTTLVQTFDRAAIGFG